MLTHEFVDVNGVRLHCLTAGEGKLLLFLHGFPEFGYAWKEQLAEFSKDYHVVAPDLRGYNLSSRPPEVEAYQMKHLVEDVRALIAHYTAEKCILVAHDWGGAVAWGVAVAHPDLLEKLVIVNSPHPAVFQRELRENRAQQAASRYMVLLRSEKAEGFVSANDYAALREQFLGARLWQELFTEEDRRAYLQAWAQPGALTGALNYYRAGRLAPSEEAGGAPGGVSRDLAAYRVKVPTLVIWGEQDTALLTGNLAGLEAFVPDLTVRRVADGSHWLVHEQPQVVNGLIWEFLA
ncbi:MAG TPA: alpha/beta hydrolase [Ktedonobacterales bacterium]